jgi:hypothetical protein
MIHEDREAAFIRMRAEADRERVHGVVGVTSELRNLSPQMLPAQAIIRDKDTWLSGSGGFDLTSIRAGG